MHELDLFEQYLYRVRAERMQQAIILGAAATAPSHLYDIKARACEADLMLRLVAALKVLKQDPGQFIQDHLK